MEFCFTSFTSAGNKQPYLGTIVPSGQPQKQVDNSAGLIVCALWCRHNLWPAKAKFSCVLQGMKAARLLGSKPAGKAPRSAPGMQASMMMYPGIVTTVQIKHRQSVTLWFLSAGVLKSAPAEPGVRKRAWTWQSKASRA